MFATLVLKEYVMPDSTALSLIDRMTNTLSVHGFSIKSKLKAKPTLINSSGKSTGFRYKIEDFDFEKLEEVNSIEGKSKVNQRVKKILEIPNNNNTEEIITKIINEIINLCLSRK